MSVHPSRKHLVRRRHVMWFVWDVIKISTALILLGVSGLLAYWGVVLVWGGQ